MTKTAEIKNMQNIFDAMLESTGSVSLALEKIIPFNPTTLDLESAAGVEFLIGISETIDRDVVALFKRESHTPSNLDENVVGDFSNQFYLDSLMHEKTELFMNKTSIPKDETLQFVGTPQEMTGETVWQNVNKMVKGLINKGIWDKCPVIIPWVGDNAGDHKWNLIDPRDDDSAHRLEFYGGLTHDATGCTPNGSTGWARLFLPMSTLDEEYFLTIYNRTNAASAGMTMGARLITSPTNEVRFYPKGDWNNRMHTVLSSPNTGYLEVNIPNPQGVNQVERTSTTRIALYHNDVMIGEKTSFADFTAHPDNELVLFASSYGPGATAPLIYHGTHQQSMTVIGSGILTDQERTDLHDIIVQFQTDMKRNV